MKSTISDDSKIKFFFFYWLTLMFRLRRRTSIESCIISCVSFSIGRDSGGDGATDGSVGGIRFQAKSQTWGPSCHVYPAPTFSKGTGTKRKEGRSRWQQNCYRGNSRAAWTPLIQNIFKMNVQRRETGTPDSVRPRKNSPGFSCSLSTFTGK